MAAALTLGLEEPTRALSYKTGSSERPPLRTGRNKFSESLQKRVLSPDVADL